MSGFEPEKLPVSHPGQMILFVNINNFAKWRVKIAVVVYSPKCFKIWRL
jgi:hypothetical protein